jgi:hypothetical protein
MMSALAMGAVLAGGLEAPSPPVEERLRIGPTGVYCVRAPCPWRGVTRLDAEGRAVGRPLWSGERLPTIVAGDADKRRIMAVWRVSGCLVAQGRFEAERLIIRRVIGAC